MEYVLPCNFFEVSNGLLSFWILVFLKKAEYEVCPINIVEYLLHVVDPAFWFDVETDVENNCETGVCNDDTDHPIEECLPLRPFTDNDIIVPLLFSMSIIYAMVMMMMVFLLILSMPTIISINPIFF